MSPLAYGVRDQHDVFQKPYRIDTQATIQYDTPSAFKKSVDGDKVAVLPLVVDHDERGFPGWCSYASQLSESPDIEVMCGGINSKAADAAGLWRQGHLLHFGFDLEPSAMNDIARSLLVNSVHYIARFRNDRAILRSPSPFAGGRASSRKSVRGYLDRSDRKLEWFTSKFVDGVVPETEDRAALKVWFAKVEGAIYSEGVSLAVDENVLKSGLRNDDPKFLRATLAAGDDKTFLRYLPEFSAFERATWSDKLTELKGKMFFSDWGGYRWYLDPLAMQADRPSSELRGSKRALEVSIRR